MLRRLAPLTGVPRILFEQQTAVGPALGETLLAGVPLARRLDRRSFPALADAAVDWLVRLAQHEPRLAPATPRPVSRRTVADAFLECVEPALDTGLIRDGLALLDDFGNLPTVTEHRDFAPWNVLVDARASLNVVDWESAVAAGLPLLDLWYFLTHLGLAVEKRHVSALPDAYVALTDPGRPTGRVLQGAVERYVTAVGLPADAIPGLRAATWMAHVPAEMRRLGMASGAPAAPAQVRQAAFVRLWQIEVRRAAGAGLPSRRG
jgi:hypothetical protein